MKLSHIFLLSVFLLSLQAHAMEDNRYDIVEHVYNTNVIYRPGSFPHYKDGPTFSTQAQRSQKSWAQNVLKYSQDVQSLQQEVVLKRVIPGQDGRTRVTNTTDWPYSIHAHLNMTIGRDEYGGSGSMVGPHHLLTCGHNVYYFNKQRFFDTIEVYPALNENVAPFGKVRVTKAYLFKGWRTSGDQQFDMALLLLDQPMGEYVGWGGLLSTADDDLSTEKVHITGYPGDKGLKQMWSMSHTIKTVKSEEFDYEIDTYGGQSGSAIWINKWGTPMIVGVHTLGSNAINSGVRISGKKFTDLLVKRISETYVLSQASVSSALVPMPTEQLTFSNPFRSNPFSPGSAQPQPTTVTTSNTQANIQIAPNFVDMSLIIPPISRGYEEIYQRFLNGKLIYRPQEGSDVGRIELPISALQNPLEGTFDLSQCGADANKYLSVSTGYRKGKKAENANKLEIWLTPRFLIEKELQTTASHFQGIMGNWSEVAPVGIFWTWGGWDELTWYDYQVTENMNEVSNDNAYRKWWKIHSLRFAHIGHAAQALTVSSHVSFIFPKPQPVDMSLIIPPISRGYEKIYQRFLNGKLIYRPQERSDVGRIELPILALQNPLEGTFDLSQCGNTGQYLSISTGYRKRKKPENAKKLEVWFAPRFLIENEIASTASHFKGIMGGWNKTAPVGIFWTWGSLEDLESYDYNTAQDMDEISNKNLYDLHPRGRDSGWIGGPGKRVRNMGRGDLTARGIALCMSNFICELK